MAAESLARAEPIAAYVQEQRAIREEVERQVHDMVIAALRDQLGDAGLDDPEVREKARMVEEVVRSQMLEDAKTSDNPASSKVIEAYDTFQRPWSEEGGPD